MIKNLDQLKARVSISEFISSYLVLKKEAGLLKACCPFHSEKTPSFVVNDKKGYFHCFGCKKATLKACELFFKQSFYQDL